MRKVLNECRICRQYGSKTFSGPPSPSLPDFRVKASPPFTTTGVDYAGPLYLRGGDKVWICLFTDLLCCASSASGTSSRFDSQGIYPLSETVLRQAR